MLAMADPGPYDYAPPNDSPYYTADRHPAGVNVDRNYAVFDFDVDPPDAIIWMNGQRTVSTGRFRQMQTPYVVPGRMYNYELVAVWPSGERIHRKLEFKGGDR